VATRAKRLAFSREVFMLVAILDDDTTRCAEMERSLTQALPDATPEFFDSAPDMIAWLARHIDDVALVSLTHDLGPSRFRDGMLFDPGTGRDVTDFLIEMDRSFPVIVHTTAGPRSKSMLTLLEHAEWPCVQVEPKGDSGWIGNEWAPCVAEMLGT
jgi:hypothetical protein